MTYKLKIVALAAMAISAIGMLGAAPVQAAPEIHCESYPCYLHGNSAGLRLTIDTGEFRCIKNTGATVTSTLSATATTVVLEATYPKGNCSCNIVECQVDMNGCTFLLHLTQGDTTEPYATTTDIVCPAGKAIEMTAGGVGCSLTVKAQTGLEGLGIDNEGSGSARAVSMTLFISGVHYVESGVECVAPGTHTNGVFEGGITLTGYKEVGGVRATSQGVWVSPEDPPGTEFHCTEYPCSAQGTSSDHQFTVGTGIVKCAKNGGATVRTAMSTTATAATLEPVYPSTNCTAFGVAAKIALNGCDLLVHLDPSDTTEPYSATVDIVCPVGASVTVTPTGLNCEITVGAQAGLSGLELDDEEGETRSVKATINISGIHYVESGSECASPGTHTNGQYHGSATLAGEGIWVE